MTNDIEQTIDHSRIRKRIESRNGRLVRIENRTTPVEGKGVIQVIFSDTLLEEQYVQVSWEEFFTRFDQAHLAFVYERCGAEDVTNRFYKFVNRNGE